jgi:hypothetical protein
MKEDSSKVEFEEIADELAALIKPLGPHAGMYESIPEHTRLVVTRAISALRFAAPKVVGAVHHAPPGVPMIAITAERIHMLDYLAANDYDEPFGTDSEDAEDRMMRICREMLAEAQSK